MNLILQQNTMLKFSSINARRTNNVPKKANYNVLLPGEFPTVTKLEILRYKIRKFFGRPINKRLIYFPVVRKLIDKSVGTLKTRLNPNHKKNTIPPTSLLTKDQIDAALEPYIKIGNVPTPGTSSSVNLMNLNPTDIDPDNSKHSTSPYSQATMLLKCGVKLAIFNLDALY